MTQGKVTALGPKAFLISKKAVPLDPIADVERAKLGDRVRSSLSGYTVVEMPQLQVTPDLVLEQVDLLLPDTQGKPVILTRHPELVTGNYLKTVTFDGYLLDANLLGIPKDFVTRYGVRLLVVNGMALTFDRGVPTPGPTPTPPPVPTPSPTPGPTPTPPPTPGLP